jgi:hypothetical protein
MVIILEFHFYKRFESTPPLHHAVIYHRIISYHFDHFLVCFSSRVIMGYLLFISPRSHPESVPISRTPHMVIHIHRWSNCLPASVRLNDKTYVSIKVFIQHIGILRISLEGAEPRSAEPIVYLSCDTRDRQRQQNTFCIVHGLLQCIRRTVWHKSSLSVPLLSSLHQCISVSSRHRRLYRKDFAGPRFLGESSEKARTAKQRSVKFTEETTNAIHNPATRSFTWICLVWKSSDAIVSDASFFGANNVLAAKENCIVWVVRSMSRPRCFPPAELTYRGWQEVIFHVSIF